MSIPIETAPASLPPEAQEYIQRILIIISGAMENMELEISQLKDRVKALESP